MQWQLQIKIAVFDFFQFASCYSEIGKLCFEEENIFPVLHALLDSVVHTHSQMNTYSYEKKILPLIVHGNSCHL